MTKIEVKLDAAALKKIRGSKEVMGKVTAYARALARRANGTLKQKQPYPDYGVGVTATGENPHAAVYTQSNHAKYSNAKHNTLVKLV